jgi:DNA invertase Pin-like site-specific DNA recombinase
MSAMNAVPLIGYARVSTTGQATSGVGIAAQRQALADAAQMQGLAVSDILTDEAISGRRMANRPGLQAAIAALRSGEASGLVVSKVDRLGRNASEVLALADQADREGWRLVVLDVGLDTATTSGRLVLGMLAIAARFEHDRISERQVEKFRELRQQGRPRGLPAADRALADRMIAMRDDGHTLDSIAAALNSEGIPTPRSSSSGWRRSSVRSVIETRRLELEAQGVTAP